MLFRLYLMGSFCFLLVFGLTDILSDKTLINKQILFYNNQDFDQSRSNTDVLKYMKALRRIVDFCGDHKDDVDINFYFGLFLANASVKRVYRDKYQTMPLKIRHYLLEIIVKLEELSKNFHNEVAEDLEFKNYNYKAIFTLFTNESKWINKLPQFHEQHLAPKLENVWKIPALPSLTLYNDENLWVPNPKQSNLCLAALATARKIRNGTLIKCEISDECIEILKEGTDFGYALAHRLLLLLLAKLGHRCYILSENEDKQLSQRFCSIAYQEAEHIAGQDYILLDVFLEHVTLCALDGHSQFLRRSWLSNILRFQTAFGCFSQDIRKVLESFELPRVTSTSSWKIANNRNHDIMGGYCNGHTTALAASTLASAIRLILDCS